LASGAGRQNLSRDAPLLAEACAAFDLAAGPRDVAAAWHKAGLMAPGPIMLRGPERSNARRSLLTGAIPR
jgi:hypothetical protein